jgi:hypothetical protein
VDRAGGHKYFANKLQGMGRPLKGQGEIGCRLNFKQQKPFNASQLNRTLGETAASEFKSRWGRHSYVRGISAGNQGHLFSPDALVSLLLGHPSLGDLMKPSICVVAFIAAIVAMCLPVPSWGANGNIGIYFDSSAAAYCANIECQCTGRLYVYGLLQGASVSGFTGAEYKVAVGPNTSADPGWLFSETFNPAATVLGTGSFNLGDPQQRGVDVVWPACQQGDGVKVLIETVDIYNGGCGGELELEVVKHDTPSNAFFQCPLFVLCDAPVYTKVCLGSNLTLCRNPEPPFPINATCSTSGRAFINPAPWRGCGIATFPCQIGVERNPWSRVKALYRD